MVVTNFDDVEIVDFSTLSRRPYQHTWVTIGNFDGVHLGHQAILNQMVLKAQLEEKPVVVITFFPNPSDYFQREQAPFYLSTPKEKEILLKALGVRDVLTFHFNQDLANLSAGDFLSGLKAALDVDTLVVGHNFVLGKNRAGTIPVIQSIGERLSFSLEVVPAIEVGQEEISSTEIRNRLEAGDVQGAARLLGRLYQVSGSVTHGSDRGARIGLPTANLLHWPKKKLPGIGVYVTRAWLKDKAYEGITNVGFRPTFEKQDVTNVETHLLDFDGNIYGEQLALDFIEKIRDEQKFDGVSALLAQIERDKATARRIFSHDKT